MSRNDPGFQISSQHSLIPSQSLYVCWLGINNCSSLTTQDLIIDYQNEEKDTRTGV